MIVAASVVGGSTISILAPARMALSAEIVSRDGLTNAIMLGTMSAQVTRVVGPAAAGVMIGISVIGIAGVYWVSAVLSLIAVGLSVTLPEGAPRFVRDSGPLEDLKEGIRYTRSKPELVRLLVMSLGVVMFGFAHQAFLPTVVADLFDRSAGSLGLLTTVAAVGAVITSVALANTPREQLRQRQNTAAYVFGGAIILFAVMPNFGLALGAMFVVGCGMSAFQSLNGSLILSSADMEYHGRVQSLIMLSFSAFGLAALPFGVIADRVGLRETMAGMGVAVILTAAHSTWWRRRIVAARIPDPLESL